MKKALLASAVLAILVVAQQSAWAASFGSPLSEGGSPLLNTEVATAGSGSNRSFSDTVSFSLTDTFSSLVITVNDFERQNNGTQWAGNTLTFSALSGSGSGFNVARSGSSLVFTSSGALNAGSYTLSLSGSTSTNTNRLRYDVSYTAVASPVPEPETYALMLAGLGVVGWAARRRKLAASTPLQALPA